MSSSSTISAVGYRAAVGDIPLVVGDVRDIALVSGLLHDRRIDAVIHFAALKSVEEIVADPGAYFDDNVGGTLAVLRAMAAADVRRIVFSSSCAVYGTPDRSPVDEDAPRPTDQSVRRDASCQSERLLPWFEAAHGIRSAVLRYFNAAGAADDGSSGEDWTDAPNLIPVVLSVAAGRRDGGPRVRDGPPDTRRERDPRLHPRPRPCGGPSSRARDDRRLATHR